MNDTDNQAVAAVAPGAALAAAREAHSLSVAEAARQINLSVSQIEALEAGAYEKLPGPVFVRGFIRNYARLLRLDPEEVLRLVEPVLPTRPAREKTPPSKDIPFPPAKTRQWPWYAIGMLLLIAGLAVYEFHWNEPEFTVLKSAPALQAAAPGASPTDPAVAPPATMAEPAPMTSSPLASISSAITLPNAADSKAAAAAPKPVAVPEDDRLSKPGERPVRLVFDAASWVEIRDGAGKVIFSQLNQAGSERRVYGRPPLSLIVGNARGVRLTYNEQPVNLERHTKVDVARFTLE